MGRKQYKHLPLTCHRGINQQRGTATLEECAEASNVWAPDGVVEQRPGYRGVTSFPYTDCADQTATTVTNTYITENLFGVFQTPAAEGANLTLNSWPENAFWYIGFTQVSGTFQKAGPVDLPGSRSLIGYNTIAFTSSNSSAIRYEASYYNGTEFVPLRVIERIGNPNTEQSPSIMVPHLGDTRGSLFAFCPPGDWGSSVINGVTAFFIRFKLKRADSSTTSLDDSVLLDNNAAAVHVISPEYNVMRGFFAGQFPTTKRYIAVSNNRSTSPSRVCWMMASDHEFTDVAFPDFESLESPGYLSYHDNTLATHAVVPQFGEGFVAYGGRVKRYSIRHAWRHGTDGADFFATDAEKETRDFAVGDEAPFDPNYVAAQRNFPNGTYIVYFKNRLWVAGMKGEPFTVRWGAAIPYHKVFPETANDVLMEDDNSFITGMAPLGEHMVVFKRDSIWLMVAVGENPITQVTDFRGRKIVGGVGCISHHSIQQIRGRLVFLAEDGVYAFDGTANIEKISDRVDETVSSINMHRAAFTVSAHWKTNSCYLLSVPTNGANDNNTTLVFDYKNSAWWIWDIPAVLWLNDEGQADEESLYFVDGKNCMHQMGVGNTDHGQAITSSVVTQRIGETDNIRRTVRQVEVITDNLASSLTVAVRSNDDSNNDDSGTLSLTDDSEAKYASNLLFAVSTNYVLDRNRARRLSFRKQGDWLQVFVSHNAHNTPMKLRVIDVGLIGGPTRQGGQVIPGTRR